MYSTSIQNGGLGFSPRVIGIVLAFRGLIASLFQLTVSGKLVRRYGPRKTLVASFYTMIVTILTFPLMNVLAKRNNCQVYWAVWVVMGLQIATSVSQPLSYCVFFPPHLLTYLYTSLSSVDACSAGSKFPDEHSTSIYKQYSADDGISYPRSCTSHCFFNLLTIADEKFAWGIFCIFGVAIRGGIRYQSCEQDPKTSSGQRDMPNVMCRIISNQTTHAMYSLDHHDSSPKTSYVGPSKWGSSCRRPGWDIVI
jgi:hypothetical protein